MRKAFDRLRRWLIKKLGGYTEQFPPLQRQIIRKADLQTQKIQAQISVEVPPPGSSFGFEQYCKRRVTETLVKNLEESAYIQWEHKFDMSEQRLDVRATLYVADAEYAKPYFQYWVE